MQNGNVVTDFVNLHMKDHVKHKLNEENISSQTCLFLGLALCTGIKKSYSISLFPKCSTQ